MQYCLTNCWPKQHTISVFTAEHSHTQIVHTRPLRALEPNHWSVTIIADNQSIGYRPVICVSVFVCVSDKKSK